MLEDQFFSHDPQLVARGLLGKVLHSYYQGIWLSAQIIETEAYYLKEKGSHSFLGYTQKRKAMFMPPGTIYMYYARGGDSMNISCGDIGDAVLVKSGIPYGQDQVMLDIMLKLNPRKNSEPRPILKLCAGQTLLCKALNIKVPDWDQKNFDRQQLWIEDIGYQPKKIIATTRLGIPQNRDPHLPYRFILDEYKAYCTKKPKNETVVKINE